LKIINNELLNELAVGLEDLAMQIRNVQTPESPKRKHFDFSCLSEKPKRYLDELRKWDNLTIRDSSYIYIYVITAEGGVSLSSVAEAFSRAKKENLDGRAYARMNGHESQTLYVGSSRAINKRVAEHLGFGSKHTYALHMRYWAEILEGRFSIVIYRFDDCENKKVIQAIEDGLWDQLKPMFGKQGAK